MGRTTPPVFVYRCEKLSFSRKRRLAKEGGKGAGGERVPRWFVPKDETDSPSRWFEDTTALCDCGMRFQDMAEAEFREDVRVGRAG